MHTVKKLNVVLSALMLAVLPVLFAACKKPCETKAAVLSTVAPISGNAEVTVPTSHADTSNKNIDTYIILNNENTTINGSGASFSDSVLTISKSGSYLLKGKLSDGRIVVDSHDADGKVCLYLDGVTARSSEDSPLTVNSAGRELRVILLENTSNGFFDFSDKGDFPVSRGKNAYTSAVLFSKSDIYFEGEGTLEVGAKYKKGIYSEHGLTVLGGNINIESADDAIGAKNNISFHGGTLNAVSGAGGIRTGRSDAGKGSVTITAGTFKIQSALDCIRSSSSLVITSGSFDLTSGGGSTGKAGQKSKDKSFPGVQPSVGGNSSDQTIDARDSKAIRAEKLLKISGGEFAVNSLDDAFYSAGKVYVSDGDFNIKTDSTSFYAGAVVTILGGNIKSEYCLDGIGGKKVFISGGNICISAEENSFGEYGNVLQSGGTVVAFGSNSGTNGKSTYTITGGTVFYAGDLPLKKAAVRGSAELSATATFPESTLLAITNSEGKPLFCLSLAKNCKSIWFSSPELTRGEKYKIYSGGINTGVSQNGIYYGTQYTPGWLVDTVEAL